MKLRKLELFGFKSFYDKTSFDFSEGITAIVGPNGCGKSNIVDAIRWVLGEHAPSYIRSKALEDVIFAGSDAAGPLGMAEVTLTFGNEDGGAPPGYEQYAEIQVTRRASRDGESEFLINRMPCRLKDIAELFLDTGAGARGYAIIEQGKIATLPEARPDEKRMLIEEAAGVAKFRVRRKEAERKMESTRQNLARVRDIHDEVKRQLGSLERQVRKAERFKVLKDELRGVDLGIAARKFRSLAAEAARLSEEHLALENRLAGLAAEAARAEAGRESRRADLARADAALQDLRRAQADRREEAARREEEHKGRVREASVLGDAIAEGAREIETLGVEIGDLTARIAEADAALVHRAAGVASWRERAEALGASAVLARAAASEARASFEQARNDLFLRVSLHSNARVSAESHLKLLEENERAEARFAERIADAREAAGRTEGLRDAAAAALEAADGALAAAERLKEETEAQIVAVNARLEAVVEARRQTDAHLASSSSRLSALSRLYERRDWASEGVRAVLHHYDRGASNRGESPDRSFVGVMAELIETEAPYEKAVEAALGERVQSIVVRDQEEGRHALEYLKASREGRVSFVPVKLRWRDEAPAYAGEDGVIAPLTEIVRAPGGCEELVRGLFGGTLLVRDLECALRLWNRNGVWNSYVTLDGDMVTADGIMMGGARAGEESGVLAGRREIRDLEAELAGLTAESARLAGEEDEARRERAALEARREEASRERDERARDHGAARERHAALESALAQERARDASLEDEIAHLRGERERIRSELSASEVAARETEEARGAEEERVRRLGEEDAETRSAAEAAAATLHEAALELSRQEGEERSERGRWTLLRDALAGKRTDLEERRARKAAQEERAAALAAAIEAGRAAIEAAAGGISAAQEEIDRIVAECSEASASLAAIEDAIRAVRASEAEANSRFADARLAEQRVAMELSALEETTYQRYELVPAELPAPDPAEEDGLAALGERAEEIRRRMASIGDVNLGSIEEHRELTERHAFLSAQEKDMETSLEDLTKAIQRINRTTRERFAETYEKINATLGELFPKLVGGGNAYLTLTEEDNLLDTGVEIVAQLPGKKPLPLRSISGGEKTLTAASFIFSLFLIRPSPFCLLDEADAALDDANIDRFNALVRELSARYQILLITHNKRTMELADVLYGITMEKPGISKVVSVKFQ